ncbi:hypothetical protein SAHL_14590 [Salinisphaera orenii YIM 95161]|uniref:Uncharacterized protein n=1 Tax=Salinisphaera orenii YIM 95161 TaxID=1051139 RepID=A0A423PI04_9GAMM|nr:hypothetical protein SAHL_14590 [Salinisphaera halophila YIM 95161]
MQRRHDDDAGGPARADAIDTARRASWCFDGAARCVARPACGASGGAAQMGWVDAL